MGKITTILTLLFATAQFALATTLLRMDLDDLTAESHAIVYGKIVASRAEWNNNRSMIYTIYTVEATQYLKGSLGASFELQEPGGERDGLMVRVPSVPVFRAGEEAVLFVWTDPKGRHQVIGFEQGAMEVRTNSETGEKTVDRVVRLGSARSASKASLGPSTSRLLPQLFGQIRLSVVQTNKPQATQ